GACAPRAARLRPLGAAGDARAPAHRGRSGEAMSHSRPSFAMPAGACDCHVHVFGPTARFPFAPGRGYTPGSASAAELAAHQRTLGLDRVVVVQPSVYGTDNSCTLDAIARLGLSARGVAVIDPAAPAEEL